jgi:hypothetical protein
MLNALLLLSHSMNSMQHDVFSEYLFSEFWRYALWRSSTGTGGKYLSRPTLELHILCNEVVPWQRDACVTEDTGKCTMYEHSFRKETWCIHVFIHEVNKQYICTRNLLGDPISDEMAWQWSISLLVLVINHTVISLRRRPSAHHDISETNGNQK